MSQTQACSRKHNEVLDFINQWASVLGLFVLPSRPSHLSWFVFWQLEETAQVWRQLSDASVCWLKIRQWNNLPLYSPAVSQKIQSDSWRIDFIAGSTPQGCYNYHRPSMVVWKVKVWYLISRLFFNCLSKALMLRIYNIGETSCAMLVFSYM